ncbi:LLM class flavin-dependent oxidoreductase [Thermomonospora umbrina]|uniref:Alkanesulfonate monooxygenase n=1 Tax=Thermomonospora umbrina TaxID=111806 RepID=A0A3D9SLR6_9ACTN|nr:LLM class flavin-dependent oxidoreductase [Thermomonospora umbrina]REE96876.1 alkanesulfonate monooxygenase [Thermomonospora umbrina]
MGVDVLITVPTRERGGHRALPGFVTDLRPGAYGPYDRLAQVGRAAEIAGLGGAYVPFDPVGEESWVVASGLLRGSRFLRVVAGFHPSVATPVYAAKVSASLQRFSANRLDWRLDVDLDPAVARAQGDFLEGPARYARADEFLTVAKGVWDEDGYTFEGRFYDVLEGGFDSPLSDGEFPRVHLSGTSPEALLLSARHADVHVFSLEDDLDSAIAELEASDRDITYALSLPVLVREDDDEAWDEARRQWIAADPPGLVGSYATVASRLREFAERGVTTFVLDVQPHVEETYRLGEHLLPLLAKEAAHAG